jgi:hypothetical protein
LSVWDGREEGLFEAIFFKWFTEGILQSFGLTANEIVDDSSGNFSDASLAE